MTSTQTTLVLSLDDSFRMQLTSAAIQKRNASGNLGEGK